MTHNLGPNAMAEEYLAELERAAIALPANRGAELLADIRSHIEVARSEAQAAGISGPEDEAVVRKILSQLGDPQEIVAAAVGDLPAAPRTDLRPRTRSALLEAFALILLLIGGLLFWPVPHGVSKIGWLGGLVLLGLSARWSVGDKLIGVAGVALAPPVLSGLLLFPASTETCTRSPDVTVLPRLNSPGQADTLHSVSECSTSGLVLPPALTICLVVGLFAAIIFAAVRLAGRMGGPKGCPATPSGLPTPCDFACRVVVGLPHSLRRGRGPRPARLTPSSALQSKPHDAAR